MVRRLPLWAQGDATTLPGYSLVITEVDWYAVDPVVAFVLEVSDGEAVESLLYGRHSHVDPGAPAGHGSWRSVQGAPVPPGWSLVPRPDVAGSEVIIRGFWVDEALYQPLQVAPGGPDVPMQPRPFPTFPAAGG